MALESELATVEIEIARHEKEMDQAVYKLYGLTPEEIALVE
jgi:hypothetical protein